MENNLLKIQKSSSAKIIADCTQPSIMMAYVNYSYLCSGVGNPNRRNTIGDSGEFVIYENANHECVMVCYNATDDTIIFKRTRGESNIFPTFMDFGCSMFNMCFSEVFGTYGIRHRTHITVISDEETVARTLPYLTELFESFKKTSGILLQTDYYTAVFDNFLFRHIAADSHGRLYLYDKRCAETEEDIKRTVKEFKLITSSFFQFNTDGENVDEEDPQDQIVSPNVPGEKESDIENVDENKTTEQLSDEINELADEILAENKKKEDESDKRTIERPTCLPANDDIFRFTINMGDKSWSEPRYVRAKNFPKVLCIELKALVECFPVLDCDKFVIKAEKILVE